MPSKSWLAVLKLTDTYDRKARLAPGLVSLTPLVPLVVALGGTDFGWLRSLVGGAGVSALLLLVIGNLASLCGNRMQRRLWPDWPFDSPTNVRLMPTNGDTSPQQRALWYGQVRQSTGLDLEAEARAGDAARIRATVNDAVERLRNAFRRSAQRARLEQESIRYGYARNLAGLWPIWLGLGAASCAGTWGVYYCTENGLGSAVVASGLLIGLVLLALSMPAYVRVRAKYYSEVFFRLLEESAQKDGGA